MATYIVTATRETEHTTTTGGRWVGVEQIPAFLLDGDIQGIRSTEHAERIARDIVGGTCHVTAVEV